MSRRKNKDVREKTVRVSQNPISGRLESIVLDAPQLAYERAIAALDRALCALPTTASAPWYAVVTEAHIALACLEAGEDVLPGEPWGTLAREWDRLDAAGRFRFAAKVRERLAKMVPNTN